MHLFQQCLADAVCDAAMHLAMHDHRIYRTSDIIDRAVRTIAATPVSGSTSTSQTWQPYGNAARFTVSSPMPIQPAKVVGKVVALHRRSRHVEDANRPVGALHRETSVGEFDVGRGDLQYVAGDPQSLLDDLVRRTEHDDAAETQRAPGMRPATDRDTAVSPCTNDTLSNGTPSHSLTSWQKLVSCPWPLDTVPMTTSTTPSGCTVISARSRGTPVAVST